MNSAFPDVNHCTLRHQALTNGNGAALDMGGRVVDFCQLDAWVEASRRIYQDKGLVGNDRLLVLTEQPLDTLILALACLRSQWLFCPVNRRLPEAQLNRYKARIGAALVTTDCGVDFDHEPALGVTEPFRIQPDAVADLVATSGTTGVPKAVAHCYRNHYFSARGALVQLPLYPGDRWLLSLPLFHVGGFAIIMRCLLSGATMVLPQQKSAQVKSALEDVLMAGNISHLSLVNTQLFRLLDHGIDLYRAGVRYVLLGGGIASPHLVEQVQCQGVRLLTTYGMTEMASQVCTGEPVFAGQGVTSGVVLPWRELTLAQNGEILVRGKTLALGYYEQGTLVSLVDEAGWYHTGDQGSWVNGQVQIFGRLDHMMISGGENIHPQEIEQALLMQPDVVQAVVVPVSDREFGQRPVAYVQTVDGTVNEDKMKSTLRERIAGFKVPQSIQPFPSGVAQAGIKVDRRYFYRLAQGEEQAH